MVAETDTEASIYVEWLLIMEEKVSEFMRSREFLPCVRMVCVDSDYRLSRIAIKESGYVVIKRLVEDPSALGFGNLFHRDRSVSYPVLGKGLLNQRFNFSSSNRHRQFLSQC